MKTRKLFQQFNWRFLLVRILVNAIALAITAAILPRIYFVDKSIWNLLFMALMLGVLNALLKPILQFLTLHFIFATYGLVIVLINALILLLLSFLFPARFAVGSLLWALVGGLVLGLLSSFLEALLGLTRPIVPDEPPGLRRQVEEQERQVSWLTAASSRAAEVEPAPDAEPGVSDGIPPGGEGGEPEEELAQPPEADAKAAGPGAALPAAELRSGPEPAIPEPGEEPAAVVPEPAGEDQPSRLGETELRRSASDATADAEATSQASISAGPESAAEPHGGGEEEDPS